MLLPNRRAVLAFAREGYRWRNVDGRHLRQTFGSSGFRHFARENWRFGLDEMARSLSRRRFTAAVARLADALDDFVIDGLTSNLPLLRAIVAHEDFRENRFHTRWLEQTLLPTFEQSSKE